MKTELNILFNHKNHIRLILHQILLQFPWILKSKVMDYPKFFYINKIML